MRCLISILIFASACSSELKRAQQLLANDAAVEAEASFEKLVAKDPHNTEATIGLENARARVVDRGLIDVRMLRLAENPGPALERLNSLLEREKNWNLRLNAQVASTQREEVGYASYYLDQEIQSALQKRQPLLAQDLSIRYPSVVVADERAPWLAPKRRALITASGLQNCRAYLDDYRSSRDNPNYADFVLRYCRFFAPQSVPTAIATKLARTDTHLYRDITIQWTHADGVDASEKSLIEANLRQAFRQSPWYAASTQDALPVSLDGRLQEKRRHEPVIRTYNYSETEYFDVKKPVDREVTTERTIYRDGQPVVERTTQKFPETITVTESREVSRSVDYRAFENEETLNLSLTAQFSLPTGPLSFDFLRHEHRQGDEHDFERIEIGLTPQAWRPTDTYTWLSQLGDEASAELHKKFQQRWAGDYCASDDIRGQRDAQVWDAMWKCLRGNHAPAPAFADAWFEKQLGVDVASAVKYLGAPDGS